MSVGERKSSITVAWQGLPYYAARAIGEARRRLPATEISVIATKALVPYDDDDLERLCGSRIHWVSRDHAVSWDQLGLDPPDLFAMSGWHHPAYTPLAKAAKASRGATVVCMADNYFHRRPKQIAGLAAYRMFLRSRFDYNWVPGVRGAKFMRMLGVPQAQIRTGLYCADPDLYFPPDEGAARSGIVSVGQFIERKGVPELLEALDQLSASEREGVWLIGHGPLRPLVEASGVRFSDFLHADELADVYRSASALLLPSRMDHWGVVGHEAALCGCLLIATRACAFTDDLIEDGVNGRLIHSKSPAEIVRAVRWLNGLSSDEIERGRRVSIEKASQFGPARWAETLGSFLPGGGASA